MDFAHVGLQAARSRVPALDGFYARRLGLEAVGPAAFAVGRTELGFEAADGSRSTTSRCSSPATGSTPR